VSSTGGPPTLIPAHPVQEHRKQEAQVQAAKQRQAQETAKKETYTDKLAMLRAQLKAQPSSNKLSLIVLSILLGRASQLSRTSHVSVIARRHVGML
jgi:hypothetical protein